jgi:hypothetical protein
MQSVPRLRKESIVLCELLILVKRPRIDPFSVMHRNSYSSLRPIQAGVPQKLRSHIKKLARACNQRKQSDSGTRILRSHR